MVGCWLLLFLFCLFVLVSVLASAVAVGCWELVVAVFVVVAVLGVLVVAVV